jgi:hypothetical protein
MYLKCRSVGCVLYQLIMQRYLLADLAELKDLPWKDDIFARAFNDGPLQVGGKGQCCNPHHTRLLLYIPSQLQVYCPQSGL